VHWQERLGEASYFYLNSGEKGDPWVVKAQGNARAEPGNRVAMALPEHHCHVFDDEGIALQRTVREADIHVALVA
jgi:multiple sugar transport system ATP-binding protein